ncbi:MAG: hypothetical protein ACXWLD_05055, partial [Rhizomicrobium sp.]
WGVLVCLLGLWRAGEKWVPVNARNALDANIQYMNYVRTTWLFYHSESGARWWRWLVTHGGATTSSRCAW